MKEGQKGAQPLKGSDDCYRLIVDRSYMRFKVSTTQPPNTFGWPKLKIKYGTCLSVDKIFQYGR